MQIRLFVAAISLIQVLSLVAHGHPGRTDSSGGHHDRKNGGYHYHNGGGDDPPVTFVEAPRVTARSEARVTARDDAKLVARQQVDRFEKQKSPPVLACEKKQLADIALENAIRLYREVVAEFPNTSCANDSHVILSKIDLPPDPTKKNSADAKSAASKLELAKSLIDDGNRSTGVEWLKDIVKRYPDTKAANEAQEMLNKLQP